jgi:hypothetical protein
MAASLHQDAAHFIEELPLAGGAHHRFVAFDQHRQGPVEVPQRADVAFAHLEHPVEFTRDRRELVGAAERGARAQVPVRDPFHGRFEAVDRPCDRVAESARQHQREHQRRQDQGNRRHDPVARLPIQRSGSAERIRNRPCVSITEMTTSPGIAGRIRDCSFSRSSGSARRQRLRKQRTHGAAAHRAGREIREFGVQRQELGQERIAVRRVEGRHQRPLRQDLEQPLALGNFPVDIGRGGRGADLELGLGEAACLAIPVDDYVAGGGSERHDRGERKGRELRAYNGWSPPPRLPRPELNLHRMYRT